jgi:Protein of unknown function (DUF1826)
VVWTRSRRGLRRILSPGVQAVVCTPAARPAWLAEVEARVFEGRFAIAPRMVLDGVGPGEIASRLRSDLPWPVLSPSTRAALERDVLGLVDLCRELTRAERLRFRLLTDLPDCECGFHVDTVPAGAHPAGLLRVYCGAPTSYVEPGAVTDLADFYAEVYRRDRVTRRIAAAREAGDVDAEQRLLAERQGMDEAPRFVRSREGIRAVPTGSVVAFKHADGGRLWGLEHLRIPREAWIHCSPMGGDRRRLAVSVNAVEVASTPGPGPESPGGARPRSRPRA